jgi:hypothetical protein
MNAATSAPLEGVSVTVCGGDFGYLACEDSGTTDATGAYALTGLPSGTYYVRTQNALGFVDESYDDFPCVHSSSCFTQGTAVTVTAGATTSGTNFALAPGGSISGMVTDALTSAPLRGVRVEVYFRVGNASVRVATTSTDTAGMYSVAGLGAGTYFALTSSSYLNEIYDNIPCPGGLCSPSTANTTGTPISATAALPATGVNFGLLPRNEPRAPGNLRATTAGSVVKVSWSPVHNATSYVVEAGVAPGATSVSIPTSGPSYTASGIPPGRYYVRVRARNAFGTGPPSSEYLLIINSDGSEALNPPLNLEAWLSGGHLTMTWSAPPFGGVATSWVVEAGSATGLADIARVTVSRRSFTFDPVPNGYYFVRVRARNGPHLSAASAEVLLNQGNVPSPPDAPALFFPIVSGSTVSLSWSEPASGAPTSYLLEAGTAPGLSDVGVLNLSTTKTAITFYAVPRGRYFVRVRAVNALGSSAASAEGVVTVSS